MIAAIILNYKTWKSTINCIESIKNTSNEVKIYVVDNDSPNNSYDILFNKYHSDEDVEVMHSGGNLGYAKGNNYGAIKAIRDGHEILLIANNDIVFEADSINKMLDSLNSNKKISSIAPLIKSLTGEIESLPLVSPLSIYDYLLSFTHVNRIINNRHSIYDKYELNINDDFHLKKIYKFSGCCFMIRSQVFEEVGMFDEGTFMYFEEDILCHKLEERGCEILHRSDAIIQHHHGKTTGNNNFFVVSEMFKSEMYYFTRYKNIDYWSLSFLYIDRILTPLINMLKRKYRIGLKEYLDLFKVTSKTIYKYKFKKDIRKYFKG